MSDDRDVPALDEADAEVDLGVFGHRVRDARREHPRGGAAGEHRIGRDNIAGDRCRRSNRRTARPQIIP